MAQVGETREKREPRLPKGPPVDKIDDDTIIDPEVDSNNEESKVESKVEIKIDDKDKKFEEIKIPKVPLPPSKRILDPDVELFYSWMRNLKPEHWAQLVWYLYRQWPRIERPPNEKNIDVGNYAIDEQWILENHGSGDYMFIVNESGKPKNAKTIVTAYVKNLSHPSYPPKVKMNELDVHFPSNKTFVDRMVAEGKLTVDLKPMNSPQALGNDAVVGLLGKMIDRLDRTQLSNLKDPKDNAINTAIEIMAKGNQAATQMMLDQMKNDDPDKLVKLMTAIMNMIPKPPEHKSDEGLGMIKIITDMNMKNAEILAKKDETILSLMTKMLEKAQTPQGDDSFDKSLDRFTKLMELTGLGEGLVGGGKKSTLEVALQYGAPILERALGIVQNLMALKAQGAPKIDPNTGKEVVQTNQPANQLPIAIASSPLQSTQDQSQGRPNGKADIRQVMEQSSVEQEEMIKQGLRQIGPKIIEALNRRTSGDTFAESIDNFLGPMVYNQLASLGEAKMIEILKTDVELWKVLQPAELQLKTFIKEFIDYGKPESDDEILEPEPSLNDSSIEAAKGENLK